MLLLTLLAFVVTFIQGPALPPEPPPAPPLPDAHIWDSLADCESGQWDRHGNPIPGSRDWTYDGRDYGIFEGGLNFHPKTWDWKRDPDMPESAADATRRQEIVVARRVLKAQGPQAWPVCSKKMGLVAEMRALRNEL